MACGKVGSSNSSRAPRPSLSQSLSQFEVDLFGGDTVTVTGTGFDSGTTVQVGGLTCSNTTIISSTQLTCQLPALSQVGTYDLELLFHGMSVTSMSAEVKISAVLGQPSATSSRAIVGFSSPQQVSVCGGKLWALDAAGSRVVAFNNVDTLDFASPDLVIGQPDLATTGCNSLGATTAKSLCTPYGFYCTSSKLIVSDSGNRRVLIWNSLPTSSQQAADLVLGQPDFTSSTINNGGLSATSIYEPVGITIDSSSRLNVVDGQGNSRVLIWSTFPTSNDQAADIVVGQAGFTTAVSSASQSKLFYPVGILSVGTKLLVSDNANRVMIWNTLPTSNGQAADVVVGQPDFTTTSSGTTASKMKSPYSMASDGTALYVADSANNRILLFNSIPVSNGTSADAALGQSSLTTGTANSPSESASTLSGPLGLYLGTIGGQTRLLAADASNNRILVWNTLPTATQTAADAVVGQASFTTATTGWIGATTDFTLSGPQGVTYDGTHWIVVDSSNNRILIWNQSPTSYNDSPDVVLGQPDSTSTTANNGGVSASSLSSPRIARVHNGKLFVSDYGNNRVLIWNSIPTTTFKAADIVLGQPDLVSNTANNGGTTAASLSHPAGMTFAGTRLYVADTGNNRILFWSTVPTTTDAAADGVLGQSDFTVGTANNGGIGAGTLNTPIGIDSDGTRLVVADANNNRILIWSTAPASLASADLVLGQPDFVSSTSENSTDGAKKLSTPIAAAFSASGKLYVSDRGNNRILQWTVSSLSTQAAAESVIGQSDFTTLTINAGGNRALRTLNSPEDIFAYSGYLFVADKGNSRVQLFTP